MRRPWPAALLILLLLPSAQASQLETYDFEVSIGTFQVGEDEDQPELQLTMVTGAISASSARIGVHAIVNSRSGAMTGATQIQVVNPSDTQGAFERFIRDQCIGEECAIERTYANPTVTLAFNATVIVYAEEIPVNATMSAPFAISSLVTPPLDLGGKSLENLTVERSLLSVSDVVHIQARPAESTTRLYMIPADNRSSVTVTDGTTTQSYRGSDRILRIYGEPLLDFRAGGVMIPFAGEPSRATIRPSPGGDLETHFRPEVMNDVLKSLGSTGGDFINKDLAKGLRTFAPILNGVIFGFGNLTANVEEDTIEGSEVALIRFDALDLTPIGGGALAQGRSDFVLLGGTGFYTTKTAAPVGPLRVPVFSLILWIIAIGAVVAGFILKPGIAGKQIGAFGMIRLIAFIFHIFALIVAFILWDGEIRDFLGTSLLTLLTDGKAGEWQIMGVTAVFELLPFFLGLFYFGTPLSLILNSALKIGGLRKAKGIGKGIGDLAVWGLGAPFIPLIMNGVVGPIVDALQSALPK